MYFQEEKGCVDFLSVGVQNFFRILDFCRDELDIILVMIFL